MNKDTEEKRQAYHQRARRATWWTAGVCGVLGGISMADQRFDNGFGGFLLVVSVLLFVWGLDYHRRLRTPLP